MNPAATLCKAHDKSPVREVHHALVDRSQVILGNPVNDQENRVNGQPFKRCGNGVCLAILLMLNGCALSPGYSVKVGAEYTDEQGREAGVYVDYSKAYRPVKLPAAYEK